MKKLFILLIITEALLFSTSVKAQTANPYLDSTSTWYELFGGSTGITNYKDFNKYYIDGDTIFSGTNYYKLYWDQIDSVWDAFIQNFITVNYHNHVYQGGLREDTLKRFYLLYQSQAIESFLFDFNLSVGDSLPDMISNYGCNTPPNVVTYIDTVYSGSLALKQFHFPPSLLNKTLYEGIGSSGGLIWTGSLCQAFEVGGCLIAYKKGLDSLYLNCGSGTTGISELRDDIIKIYPNPLTDKLNILYNSNESCEIFLYDLVGENLLLQKFTGTATLNTEQLAKGIYIYEVRNKNGVIKKGKVVKD